MRFITAHIFISIIQCHAQRQCRTNGDCKETSSSPSPSTSICDQGECTNKFELGCLTAIADERNEEKHLDIIKPRICNSNDGEDSGCRRINKEFAFDEVRIATSDWESSVVNSWIYQIILSEILDVPTTINFGSNVKDSEGSFYDRKNRFVLADKSYPLEYLKEAFRLQDEEGSQCDSHSDKPCAHLITEIWDGALNSVEQGQDEGYLLRGTYGSSLFGRLGFYIPLFTIENDPSLISHFGLKGKANREKISERFKTPTNWGDYCDKVSNCKCNCTQADGFATRPPSTIEESQSYFVKDHYKGYFRHLDKNNCTKHPDTCAGHLVNGPCSWTTYAEAQMFWQNINLESDGPIIQNKTYKSFQMKQIWNAAVATKSDVIMWWWTPSIFKEGFAGTEGEFQRVQFPVPNRECIQYRQLELGPNSRCSNEKNKRIGDKVGSCDYQNSALGKAISKGLELTVGNDKDDLFQSPALEFLTEVKLPAFAMDQIFFQWNLEKFEDAPRALVCEYVYENLDSFRTYIPYGYPRVFVDAGDEHEFLLSSALAISSFALVWVLFALVLVIYSRATMLMKIVKIDVLIWVIFGEILVVVGSLATAIAVTDATCIISKWTTMLGYTIELVPIIIKVGTINKLVREARQLQPFDLNTRRLDLLLLCTILGVTAYLTSATIVDPISFQTSSVLHAGAGDVHVGAICSSKSISWDIVDFGLQAIILIIATVLVFQSRDVFDKFNEGQGLTLMVYSHAVFLIMRIALNRLASTVIDTGLMYPSLESILKSLDIIFATSFYFGQKFLTIWRSKEIGHPLAISRPYRDNSSSGGSSNLLRNVQVMNAGGISESVNINMKRRIRQEGTLRSPRMQPKIIESLYLPAYSNGNISVSTMSPVPGMDHQANCEAGNISASLDTTSEKIRTLSAQDPPILDSRVSSTLLDPTPE